jgi:ACT domain-containing protein
MNSEKNTAVVTVLGKDRVGIIADVSRLLADYGINIKDISQTILDDIFTMVMMVDLKDLVIEESDISDKLSALGQKLGVQSTIQHTGLFNAMHTI